MRGNIFDFSFSGIKTAVLYHLRRHPELQPEIDARKEALARGERGAEALLKLSSAATLDLVGKSPAHRGGRSRRSHDRGRGTK